MIRGRWPLWRIASLIVLLAALLLPPLGASAQTCTSCTLYAITELNLRQDPSIDAPVLRFVPAGSPVYRSAGAEVNGYAPVTYDDVPGWVVALGLVASPDEIEPVAPPAPDGDARVTLSPLLLRSGPSPDAEPILVMPEGATVTLTGEGAQDGYVTVDYDGQPGWAYADLLGEPGAS
ncbi:MAG: SH3 domain-containing protein [Thermomicrobiales bacterium]|nr:SH3 domain-containing protein [Thermomicrobiales bacterium]